MATRVNIIHKALCKKSYSQRDDPMSPAQIAAFSTLPYHVYPASLKFLPDRMPCGLAGIIHQ
jgi:hypothetical protein